MSIKSSHKKVRKPLKEIGWLSCGYEAGAWAQRGSRLGQGEGK